jgi:hypothetical protein
VAAQSIAVNSNLLYDLTTTINLGLEVGMAPRWSLELPVNYNPWNPLSTGYRKNPDGAGYLTEGNIVTQNKSEAQTYPVQIRHWLIQPELRYWLCHTFEGSFFGLHAIIGGFNAGGIKLFGWDKDRQSTDYGLPYRYQGNAYGGGISYGYQWVLSNRWSIEATLGVGVAVLTGKQYVCPRCGAEKGDLHKTWVGPTKAGISLIYIIK